MVALGVRDQPKINKAGGLGGGVGGAAPQAFANTMLASWIWKGLVCFEVSFARL